MLAPASSARLLATEGPLYGRVIPLIGSAITLGRGNTNDVELPDRAVSRQHCRLESVDGKWRILDLHSVNGTTVNGQPLARARMLLSGDQIRIGESVLLYLMEDETPFREVELENSVVTLTPTAQLRPEDSVYLNSAATPATPRAVHDLQALVKLSSEIGAQPGSEAMQRLLLQTVMQVIPADRAALVLQSDPALTPRDAVGFHRGCGTAPVQLSRTVVSTVWKDKQGLLSNHVQQNEALGMAESLCRALVQSVLAAPLQLPDRMLGLLYLDAQTPHAFDQEHLQWLVAAANIAAMALENVRHREQLERENHVLRQQAGGPNLLVGNNTKLKQVMEQMARAANSNVTVLLRGESGTGKELAARELHARSPRRQRLFLPINCATLTETLAESELFGHEKGAFTGATETRKGKLELADGGTVFLDEVAELSLPIQAKLLRVLQEQSFERLGGSKTIQVDVRLIAATNRDLEAMTKAGTFRTDLYYRLKVVSLWLPPLRDRIEDLPPLAEYLIEKWAEREKRAVRGIAPDALAVLQRHHWPGNVRELENVLHHAVVMGASDQVRREDLPEELLAMATDAEGGWVNAVQEAKRDVIRRACAQGGSYVEAARLLGIHVNNLHRIMKQLGMKEGGASQPAR